MEELPSLPEAYMQQYGVPYRPYRPRPPKETRNQQRGGRGGRGGGGGGARGWKENNNGTEPFLYPDDQETGTKLNFNTLSNAGYWYWLNPLLYILAFLPVLCFGIYGLCVLQLRGLCAGLGAGALFVLSVIMFIIFVKS